ncbi:MAG: OmpA family protein [Sandaracinaceae bacterium]|nr:OmpA family protein [Sandaracinaceae bacterium]
MTSARDSAGLPSSSRTQALPRIALALLVALVAWTALPVTSSAQVPLDEDLRLRAFDLQLFTPPAAQGATFLIERPEPLRHLSVSIGLSANVATDVFQRYPVGSGSPTTLVGPMAQGELLAAIGLFEQMELGLAIPLAMAQAAGPETTTDPSQASRPNLFGGGVSSAEGGSFQVGASDLRVSIKVPLLRGDFALAGRVGMSLPPCAGESCASMPWFSSMRYWTFVPELIAAGTLGPVRIAGTLTYRMRQRREVGDFIQDDEIQLAAGATWTIVPELQAILEGQYRIGLGGPINAGRAPNSTETPLELDAGARILPAGPFSLDVGVGTGVIGGYGAPSFRGFLTARYRIDAGGCTLGPEDVDGFQDGDFCLDPDNDGDGVEDVADRCVNDAEDADGFQDDDGCPELDNDGDGAPDTTDTCPTASEDDDEFQDDDGCPEPDNDEDGVSDGVDRCPMDPEDADQFQDEDGCPEPGPRAVPVTVSDTRILIGETIYFEFDTDVIRPVSMPLLDQVAQVIGTLDGTLRIRIEGHTDNLGGEAYNVDLSFRRARAVVEYLVGRGVARERLEYRGYGPQHPVAPNDTPQGRALNRRVEFTILRPGEPASTTRRRPGH